MPGLLTSDPVFSRYTGADFSIRRFCCRWGRGSLKKDYNYFISRRYQELSVHVELGETNISTIESRVSSEDFFNQIQMTWKLDGKKTFCFGAQMKRQPEDKHFRMN